MLRSDRLELRVSPEEKQRWSDAAGGERLLSGWLRSIANQATYAEHVKGHPLPKRKEKVPSTNPGQISGRIGNCEHRIPPGFYCSRCDA